MTIRRVLISSSKIALLIVVSTTAMVGAKDADTRWADYETWQKINERPITGDHTGFLGKLHEAAKGYRQVYVNAVGIEASQGSGLKLSPKRNNVSAKPVGTASQPAL